MPLLAIVQDAGGDGGRSLLQSIPTDGASIFVYVLVLASIYAVWRGSRPGRKGPGDPTG